MTIKEWLTPDFFALNVILIALLMNLTLYGVVSNFTEDFKMSDKYQYSIYCSITFSILIYAAMVVLGFMGVISRFPYLYDNKYNFLLLGSGSTFGGNGPVFLSVAIGVALGVTCGFLLAGKTSIGVAGGSLQTDKKPLKTPLALFAVASVALIFALTLLWIVNQT